MVLSETGVDLALVLARTEPGWRLRRILVGVVIPQLRHTGAAELLGAVPPVPAPMDGPAMAAIAREALREEVTALRADLRAETLAGLRAVVPANALPAATPLPFLNRRAKALVLSPLLALATLYAGPSGQRRRVMQDRRRLNKRLREHLNWQRQWVLYPAHEFGKVAAWLEVEGATAQRFAVEMARAAVGPGAPAEGPSAWGGVK